MNKEQKKVQEVVNYVARNLYDMAINELYYEYVNDVQRNMMKKIITRDDISEKTKRLRNCQAWVIETENFYLLISYNTIVAVIEKGTHITADVLRYVYGYTSTRAQHISKFRHDYAMPNGRDYNEYRYYPVN